MKSSMEGQKKTSKSSSFLKYSGIALQMAATIALMAWIGHTIDRYVENPKPYYTLLFLLIGTMGSIFSLIKQLK